MKNEEKNNKILRLVLFVIILILLIVGITYAYYTFILHGEKGQTIQTASFTLNLQEAASGITINNAEVMTDENGITNGSSFDFSVTATSSANQVAPYYIYLTLDPNNTIDDSKVKVYLSDITNSNTYGPVSISELTAKNIYYNEYYLYNSDFILVPNSLSQTHQYQLKTWLSSSATTSTNTTTTGKTQTTEIFGGSYSFEINIETGENNLDTSGANKPDLVTGMVPVRYNGTNWVIADKSNHNSINQWYSYATSGETKGMWANAVLVKETGTVHNRDYYTNQANVGQTVSMDDILQMYVWIPRFVVDTGNYESTQAYMDSIKGTATDGNYMSPGAVNINFVDTNTTAHDAFTFGNKNLKGIWIGKFETTGAVQGIGTNANTEQACINETCNVSQVTIKPNFMPLLGQKISSLFYASRSLEQTNNPFGLISNEVDTHMMKNNEWGAVAYLSQSIYGRCTNSTTCPNIGTNTKNGYITGYGAPAGSHHDINNAAYVEPGTYETTLGQGASTTGNIYGIYDMSGGSVEYTMGVYWDNTNYWSGFDSTANSGFKGCLGTNCSSTYDGIEFFETATNSKYYNSYTTSNDYTNNSLQHAMTETARWYGNSAFFVNDYYPWCMRGGHYYYSDAGVFYSGGYNGGSGSNSIHLSLVK